MRKPRAARSSPGRQNRYFGTKDFLSFKGIASHDSPEGGNEHLSSHGNVAGDGLEAQFGTGLRPRHILEFRQGADPILRTVMCDPISAVRYMARWTGALWRRTICLGTRWRLRLTLTRLTFTTKPSEAEVSVGPSVACSERWNRASDVVLQSAEGVQNLGATGLRKIKQHGPRCFVGQLPIDHGN